jgi:hypothetical protein
MSVTDWSLRLTHWLMPAISETDGWALRLHHAAYSAYQSCVIALNEVAMSGQAPSPELLKSEATALRELTDARQ